MRRTRIKICCISSVEEARLAVGYGADALGLVSSMPSGPGVIGDDLIAEIAATVPPGVATFLLTSRTDADAIVDQQRRCGVNAIQLCDAVGRAFTDSCMAYNADPANLPRLSLQDGDELIGTNVAFVFGPFRCREFLFG